MIELFCEENSLNKRIFINPDDKNINDMIEYLKKITGVYLDPYSDTKLYPAHQKLIISYLNNYQDKYINLINFLQNSVELDAIIYCIGD